jgi:hypothetical protein
VKRRQRQRSPAPIEPAKPTSGLRIGNTGMPIRRLSEGVVNRIAADEVV